MNEKEIGNYYYTANGLYVKLVGINRGTYFVEEEFEDIINEDGDTKSRYEHCVVNMLFNSLATTPSVARKSQLDKEIDELCEKRNKLFDEIKKLETTKNDKKYEFNPEFKVGDTLYVPMRCARKVEAKKIKAISFEITENKSTIFYRDYDSNIQGYKLQAEAQTELNKMIAEDEERNLIRKKDKYEEAKKIVDDYEKAPMRLLLQNA